MFQRCINIINQQDRFITLGRRSSFRASTRDGILLITNSIGKTYKIDEQIFKMVYRRYRQLNSDLRNQACQYTDPKWENCPNRVASVYIAAIIRDCLNN